MEITKKMDKDATVPKILTVLIDKLVSLNGLQTEGIFRISASSVEVDNLRKQVACDMFTSLFFLFFHL